MAKWSPRKWREQGDNGQNLSHAIEAGSIFSFSWIFFGRGPPAVGPDLAIRRLPQCTLRRKLPPTRVGRRYDMGMTLENRSVAADHVLPHIVYQNLSEAIDWLSRVFG